MDILDQILENLELERDLGTRMVEIDRALLVPPSAAPAAPPATPKPVPEPASPAPNPVQAAAQQCDGDIAFFTGRELSAKGLEAMEKIFGAIRKIKPGVSIRMDEECKAKVCVLLGSDALKKRLPTARPMRGAWVSVDGVPAIMTFSPDYIFSHFQEGSPNMNKAKTEMWNDIKLAVARL